MKNIEEEIFDILKKDFMINKINLYLRLDELGLDSLDEIEFRVSLKNKYKIEFPDSFEGKTVQEYIEYIKK